MLDPEIVDIARRQVSNEMVERRRALHDQIRKTSSDLVARGLLNGGAHVQAVQDLCLAEVRIRARAALGAIAKTLATAGICYAPGLASDLKQEIRHSVHLGDLKQMAADTDRILPGGSGHSVTKLDREIEQTLRAIDTEVDTLVLGIRRGAEVDAIATTPSPVVFNIRNAGAVVTGSGASVSVVQNFGTQEREALMRALDLVSNSVRGLAEVAGAKVSEIVELTVECRTEAHRESPNRLRLGSLLAGLATTIQTTAALDPAYQALKAAMLLLGVPLP